MATIHELRAEGVSSPDHNTKLMHVWHNDVLRCDFTCVIYGNAETVELIRLERSEFFFELVQFLWPVGVLQ